MASTFPPQKDADLLSMATASSALITSSPTSYNLTSGMATTLAGLVTTYSDKLALATNEPTRTRVTISEKDAAKKALVQNLRDLNRYVQAGKTVTDAQKLAIKFPVYASRTPIPAPVSIPKITVTPIGPWRINVSLRQEGTTSRTFPAGVKSAVVFTYNGPLPVPTDINEWSYQGGTSKPDVKVAIDPSIAAGTTIYVTACWVSPRQQVGMLASAVATQVLGGVGGSVGQAANGDDHRDDVQMKEAA